MRSSSRLRRPLRNSTRELRKWSRWRPTTCVPASASPWRRRSNRRSVIGRFVFFRPSQLSFISTVNILFSNFARSGERPAMEVGKPMWRRSVPISTTSSSPFLNRPTLALGREGQLQPHLVVAVDLREGVRRLGARHGGGILLVAVERRGADPPDARGPAPRG